MQFLNPQKKSENKYIKIGEPYLDHIFDPHDKMEQGGGLRGERSKAPNLIFEYESNLWQRRNLNVFFLCCFVFL